MEKNYNYFLVKYKKFSKGSIETFIAKENSQIDMTIFCRDLRNFLRGKGVEIPIFAVEEIDEKSFSFFKRKGYLVLGE